MTHTISIVDGKTQNDTDFYNLLNALTDGNSFVAGPIDYQVIQSGTPGMSVQVTLGKAFLYIGSKSSYFGSYLDTTTTLSITSNSSGSTRIDIICIKFDTSVTSDALGDNIVTLQVVVGTPGAGVPATPANYTKFAEVSVANNAVSIVNANITDKRLFMKFNSSLNISQSDGWYISPDTWVYGSANTFTIAGIDRTGVFTKGTRVRFTNNSITYYGTVSSSVFSTNTTVTLFANNDFSIANSAITNPSYSYNENPQGYPGRFSYTPTYSASTGTYSAIDTAYFSVDGRKCLVNIFSNGTTSVAPQEVTATLPVNATGNQGFGILINDGGGLISGTAYVSDTLNVLHINRYDNVAFGAGASRTIKANVIYFF